MGNENKQGDNIIHMELLIILKKIIYNPIKKFTV